jgi:hypothetical protein
MKRREGEGVGHPARGAAVKVRAKEVTRERKGDEKVTVWTVVQDIDRAPSHKVCIFYRNKSKVKKKKRTC